MLLSGSAACRKFNLRLNKLEGTLISDEVRLCKSSSQVLSLLWNEPKNIVFAVLYTENVITPCASVVIENKTENKNTKPMKRY